MNLGFNILRNNQHRFSGQTMSNQSKDNHSNGFFCISFSGDFKSFVSHQSRDKNNSQRSTVMILHAYDQIYWGISALNCGNSISIKNGFKLHLAHVIAGARAHTAHISCDFIFIEHDEPR